MTSARPTANTGLVQLGASVPVAYLGFGKGHGKREIRAYNGGLGRPRGAQEQSLCTSLFRLNLIKLMKRIRKISQEITT